MGTGVRREVSGLQKQEEEVAQRKVAQVRVQFEFVLESPIG